MLKGLNELLNAENKIQWYKPLSVVTEQSRESTSFGVLTTPDEIKNVVLPENGLILVGYNAIWKSSGAAAGQAAVFIGGNQLKRAGATVPEVQETQTSGTEGFTFLHSSAGGIKGETNGTSFVTTGQVLGAGENAGGPAWIQAAAGTYNISIQFKATSGKVTAKERKLWVGVVGA